MQKRIQLRVIYKYKKFKVADHVENSQNPLLKPKSQICESSFWWNKKIKNMDQILPQKIFHRLQTEGLSKRYLESMQVHRDFFGPSIDKKSVFSVLKIGRLIWEKN